MRNFLTSAIVFGLLMTSIGLIFSENAYGDYRNSRDLTKIIQVNEYSNYVHFQPEWKSYPRNLIVDVSATWDREIVSGQEQKSEISKYGAKERKNTLQYVNGKPVVAVQYDYRDCQHQWFHYAKVGLDFFGNRFGSLMGYDNQSIPNDVYSDQLQKEKLQDGFAQFVPICTSKEFTNYEYEVSVNDDKIGFDVYFVTAENQEWNYFHSPENFDYYSNCFGHNFQRFSGTCSEVGKNSGLLVVIPDELSRPMTKISVNLTEIP
jgi:hypothetical protein